MQNYSAQLQVQEIIERVLVRKSTKKYDYSRVQKTQYTSQEHIWHFQLQEENKELKEKINSLKQHLKHKVKSHNKLQNLQTEMGSLKQQLEGIVKSNKHLQQQINQMRLKNSSISQTIQVSLDQSIKVRQSNRLCSCTSQSIITKNISNRNKTSRSNLEQLSRSPEKQILKTKKDVSIVCQLNNNKSYLQPSQITAKQQHISSLKKIIDGQQKLISSYIKEMQTIRQFQQQQKIKSIASGGKFGTMDMKHTASYNTFKPLSHAGSIVKIKRR